MLIDAVFAAIAAFAAIVAAMIAVRQSRALTEQVKLQRQDMQYRTYFELMTAFTESSKFFFEHQGIEKHIPYADIKLDEDKRAAFFYLDMVLEFLERLWVAGAEETLYRESWKGWETWIADLSKSETFLEHFNLNKKYYAKKFAEEVQRIIDDERKPSSGTSS